MPRKDPKARAEDNALRALEDRRGRQLLRIMMWGRHTRAKKYMTLASALIAQFIAEDKAAGRPMPKYPRAEIDRASAIILANQWADQETAAKADRQMNKRFEIDNRNHKNSERAAAKCR